MVVNNSSVIITIIAMLKIIIVKMIIIFSGSPGFSGEGVRARQKKRRGVEGGRSPPLRGGLGGTEPPPFANGSNTSRNTKK